MSESSTPAVQSLSAAFFGTPDYTLIDQVCDKLVAACKANLLIDTVAIGAPPEGDHLVWATITDFAAFIEPGAAEQFVRRFEREPSRTHHVYFKKGDTYIYVYCHTAHQLTPSYINDNPESIAPDVPFSTSSRPVRPPVEPRTDPAFFRGGAFPASRLLEFQRTPIVRMGGSKINKCVQDGPWIVVSRTLSQFAAGKHELIPADANVRLVYNGGWDLQVCPDTN